LTLYVDTSLLVAALTAEARTADAQAWLVAQPTDELAISDWVITEFSSALSIKLRTGEISLAKRTEALGAFRRLVSETFTVLAVSAGHFRTAATFADQHALAIKAGDALHLAIAAGGGAVLCTLDRRLAEAGPPLGVQTRLL
jgi:predicted nucleic acid-binding protein